MLIIFFNIPQSTVDRAIPGTMSTHGFLLKFVTFEETKNLRVGMITSQFKSFFISQ